jgi:hypothetical protein
MSDEFLTVATFDNPVEASLAKNRLEVSGIRAFLADEVTVAMTWSLSNAVGAIKLQVASHDFERAQTLLEERSPAVVPAAEAVAGLAAEATDIEQASRAGPSDEDEPEPARSTREENAYRAWRGAVFGLLFWPLQLYVFWLLLKVYISEEPLRREDRRRAWVAAAINVPLMLLFCLLLRALLPAS